MKKLRIAGHLFFLAYFLMALFYYKEIMLYSDNAFQCFKLVNFGTFNVEASRYSTFFVQLIPLVAVKLHLPLKIILPLYSVSFPVLYYSVYLLCVYGIGSDAAGILMILTLSLCTRQSFYYAFTETFQALVYCVLFYAFFNREKISEDEFHPSQNQNKLWMIFKKSGMHVFICLLLILLCYFAHPVSLLSSIS